MYFCNKLNFKNFLNLLVIQKQYVSKQFLTFLLECMKKKLTLSIFIILSVIQCNLTYGQCIVKANALYKGNIYSDTVNICNGEFIDLFGTINCNSLFTYETILNSNFNNSALGNEWISTSANPVFNNPCQCPFVGGMPPSTCNNGMPGQTGPDGAFAWVGATSSSSRILATKAFNLSNYTNSNSCKIKFWMMYGLTPNAGSCEDPDATDEGVHLQYSVNDTTWTDFPGPNKNPIGNLSVTPPFITTSPGSGGYWTPSSALSQQLQSTLYFWNSYQCEIPSTAIGDSTKFRWAQLATSSTAYDTWGIDNVSITCSSVNISILWSNNNNNLYNTFIPTTSKWYKLTISSNNPDNPFIIKDSIFVKINIPQTPVISLYNDVIISSIQNGNQWFSSSAGLLPGAVNVLYYPINEDNYYVKVQDTNGCWSDSSNIIHYFGLGLNENSADNDYFRINPNPATESISVYCNNKQSGDVKITVHNINGKEILKLKDEYQAKGSYNFKFNISGLSKGIYFIKYSSKAHKLTQKLVIE